MSHKFGDKSLEKLKTCHLDLVKIMLMTIDNSKIDFGIAEGHRTVSRQLELFNEGKSKIDGINKKGKHNYKPSLAVDIYTYHPDLETRKKIAYDKSHLAYIAGVVDASAKDLLSEGLISHKIRWGGNWDSDGIIDFDQTFDDFPHFELIAI